MAGDPPDRGLSESGAHQHRHPVLDTGGHPQITAFAGQHAGRRVDLGTVAPQLATPP